MRKITKILLNITFFISFLCSIHAEDLRDLKVGESITSVSERGYANFKCLDESLIKDWNSFKKCKKNEDNYHIILFEYDERYAVTEEYEGTQVAGHPVLINLAIDQDGILNEININTDPNAPFYFRKQSHLLWLRIYHKYGSQGWDCDNKKPLKNHIKIGKKYINKVCKKLVDSKIITLHSQFYFVDDKSKKENLVSKSYLQIKLNNGV